MKKILFKLILMYLKKKGYEYRITNKTHTYVCTHENLGGNPNLNTKIIIPASGNFHNPEECPSIKLQINKINDNRLIIDPNAGHIGAAHDIAPNPKGKIFITQTKSAGVGTTLPTNNLEVHSEKIKKRKNESKNR